MKSINLSVRDIEAFMALAQARHFTRAAERCHLSQSAFSQRIQRIEDTAGLKLFERSTRHVTLTPEGQVFAAEEHDCVGRRSRSGGAGRHNFGNRFPHFRILRLGRLREKQLG